MDNKSKNIFVYHVDMWGENAQLERERLSLEALKLLPEDQRLVKMKEYEEAQKRSTKNTIVIVSIVFVILILGAIKG